MLEIGSKYDFEIIVVDGGSIDKTVEISQKFSNKTILSTQKSRAMQMNRGAKEAFGDILYFLHADSTPPKDVFNSILKEIKNGFQAGSFRFKFDSKKLLLKLNAWFTRFPFLVCRGGDQSMFVTKNLFKEMNGFDESFVIMEEYDFILRAKSKTKFKLIQKDILVSARKYENNSWLKVQRINFRAFSQFRKRVSPKTILEEYKRALK
jgi:rSAM/selenodomain-associated transferase 2